MNLLEYQQCLGSIGYGKRLPSALYLYPGDRPCSDSRSPAREEFSELAFTRSRRIFGVRGSPLHTLVSATAARCQIGPEFNVLKFRTDELKLSFLSYPTFLSEAHPALAHAVTVDLVTGKARRTDYAHNLNPPILHRKESFLPPDHPLRPQFEALTRAEEAAGLYDHTATIGFKLNWEKLLREKNLGINGHKLESAEEQDHETTGRRDDGELTTETRRTRRAEQTAASGKLTEGNKTNEAEGTGTAAAAAIIDSNGRNGVSPVTIERHKTALTRYELSKPVKTVLEYGMLRSGRTLFDYGCGQGSDVRGLQALGHQAEGWDPVYRRDVPKQEADVVNFGYVLNVIEDPGERVETLVDAYRHARRVLVVSAMIAQKLETAPAALPRPCGRGEGQGEGSASSAPTPFNDGILTKRNTFQKYFEQQELQQYIEDALETTAVPVALGVFYVFREPTEQQDFLSARSRRRIDWTQISSRLGLGGPRTLWKALYEENKELLDAFGNLAMQLGRLPNPAEFSPLDELCRRLGSAKRALRAFIQGGGAEGVDWDHIKAQFGVGQPARRRWEILCEEHKELLEPYWSLALELGRMPEPEEFSRYSELREKVGSGKRALRLFLLRGGGGELNQAAEARKRDLLVYVALANLRRRVPFGHLSLTLRRDIRTFFGNYTRALDKGLELLYAAGDPGEIELACEDLKIGWQDEQALYIHRSLLNDLPPVLRAYVGCATSLFGDVAQADVIKLHKASGKVTFLVYDDFEGKPLPELRQRIKVNLRTRWVQVFDHGSEGQLLYFKERFVGMGCAIQTEAAGPSKRLQKLV